MNRAAVNNAKATALSGMTLNYQSPPNHERPSGKTINYHHNVRSANYISSNLKRSSGRTLDYKAALTSTRNLNNISAQRTTRSGQTINYPQARRFGDVHANAHVDDNVFYMPVPHTQKFSKNYPAVESRSSARPHTFVAGSQRSRNFAPRMGGRQPMPRRVAFAQWDEVKEFRPDDTFEKIPAHVASLKSVVPKKGSLLSSASSGSPHSQNVDLYTRFDEFDENGWYQVGPKNVKTRVASPVDEESSGSESPPERTLEETRRLQKHNRVWMSDEDITSKGCVCIDCCDSCATMKSAGKEKGDNPSVEGKHGNDCPHVDSA